VHNQTHRIIGKPRRGTCKRESKIPGVGISAQEWSSDLLSSRMGLGGHASNVVKVTTPPETIHHQGYKLPANPHQAAAWKRSAKTSSAKKKSLAHIPQFGV
jgi:hypothetical protein